MPKMAQDKMREAAQISAMYSYTPGQVAPKEPLTRKAAMAIMGKHYKTDATKNILKKKKRLDAENESYATKQYSRALSRNISAEDINRLKGKKR